MPARGCFVTGTDTGCGKTLASLAIMAALQQQDLRVAGMKPVASGCDAVDGCPVNDDAARLRAAGSLELAYELVNPWALAAPIAPQFAAAREGRCISLRPVLNAYARITRQVDVVIVEGVGGWRVPLSESLGMPDLACELALPVILVVGLRLGCINHALLTAEAVGKDCGNLAGWIANRVDRDYDTANETVAYLAAAIDAPCLGQIPHLGAGITRGEACAALDPAVLTQVIDA